MNKLPLTASVVSAFVFVALSACSNREGPSSFSSNPQKNPPAVVNDSPILLRSTYTEGEITRLCNESINSARGKLDQIAALDPSARNYNNTMLAFDSITADLSDETTPLTFMGYVSMDEKTSAEGSDCEEKFGTFMVEINTRKDLYDALKDQVGRTQGENRLLAETLKSFEANGLELPADQLTQVKALKTELQGLEVKFSANMNGDNTSIELSEEELSGVPSSYIAGLAKNTDGSKYVVKAGEADASMILNNATQSETRRRWFFAYNNRQANENTALMEQAIQLRQKIAKLLGFKTWADAQINGRMAKDAKTVNAFLDQLKEKLVPRAKEDIAKLLKFKQELEPKATQVDAWDINYLSYQLKKRDYSLDEEKIREYFPAQTVVKGLFEVYSKLLGVHFSEVQNADVWSPDVKLYRIEDPASGDLLGMFYMDNIPRQGKYGHAAAFPLISGRELNGKYSVPVAAMVANFNQPSEGKPSLLSHGDVDTLFHEFGHIMHQTLTRAPYASLSGTAVAQDFVEAPSQMLENWVWNEDVLKTISGHYLDSTQKLPQELLDQMINAQEFNMAYRYTRQLLFATLDMTYHSTDGPVDVTEIYNSLHKEMTGIDFIEGGHFAASFGHLMGGYDAGYYGYLWSEVYATDMYTRFASEGLLNEKTGADYRHSILEKGNMEDALDLMTEFLGRAPNTDAFFKKLHID